MACSSAPALGTTFIARVRSITGRITSAADGIRIAFMIATGSLCAVRGSMISMTMTGDLENSTGVISIGDASSVKRENFTVGILTTGGNLAVDAILIVGVGSERIAAAVLTAAHRIGQGT